MIRYFLSIVKLIKRQNNTQPSKKYQIQTKKENQTTIWSR